MQLVTKTKKMFVGGLSASTTIEDVRSYFEQFGKVRHYFIMLLLYTFSVHALMVGIVT